MVGRVVGTSVDVGVGVAPRASGAVVDVGRRASTVAAIAASVVARTSGVGLGAVRMGAVASDAVGAGWYYVRRRWRTAFRPASGLVGYGDQNHPDHDGGQPLPSISSAGSPSAAIASTVAQRCTDSGRRLSSPAPVGRPRADTASLATADAGARRRVIAIPSWSGHSCYSGENGVGVYCTRTASWNAACNQYRMWVGSASYGSRSERLRPSIQGRTSYATSATLRPSTYTYTK